MEGGINYGQDPNTQRDKAIYPWDGSTYTPAINLLPIETLMYIFQLARCLWWRTPLKKGRVDEDLVEDRDVRHPMLLPYPEALSHVCSLWRQILLSSPSLWSHIDIYTFYESSQVPLNRGSAFLARAQQHDIRIKFSFCHHAHHPSLNWAPVESFCTSVAPRLKSLQVDNFASDITLFSSTVRTTLSHATPGILTDLILSDNNARIILNPGDNSDGLAGWRLPSAEDFGMSQHLLDDIMHPIRLLWLSSRFFPWTSPAYRGLVDLRLFCTRPKRGRRPSIQASQLREILLACPELRAFHFGIKLEGQGTQETPTPVLLNDLEELNVKELSHSFYEVLLPLLSPGPKPLKLICQTYLTAGSAAYSPELVAFFQRSNVTRLYISNRIPIDRQQYLDLEHLLLNSPVTLQKLGLDRFKVAELPPSRVEHIKALSPLQLECLCLKKCLIDPGTLQEMAMKFPAQVLKLQSPEFELGDTSDGAEARAREE
ncbi:hypothetical protein FRC11_013042, partial [Ceratobasidium sp. 423]